MIHTLHLFAMTLLDTLICTWYIGIYIQVSWNRDLKMLYNLTKVTQCKAELEPEFVQLDSRIHNRHCAIPFWTDTVQTDITRQTLVMVGWCGGRGGQSAESSACSVTSVVSDSLDTTMDCSLPGSFVHGNSLSKNTGWSCHALLRGIFPTQGLNSYVSCIGRWDLYH